MSASWVCEVETGAAVDVRHVRREGEEMSDTGWEDLKAMYAAEKKRREGIEDELYAERLAHASAVTRAELAERERDEARRNAHVVGVAMSNEVAARERAEADNAVLLDVLREVRIHACTELGCMACFKRAQAEQADHPGTALLERMRETERLSEERRQLLEDVAKACRSMGPETPEVQSVVGRALERLRALETVRELLKDGVTGGHIVLVDECRELSEACKAADVLKVPRE